MKSNQSDVDHLSGYRADLYSISDSDTIFSDQEEITDDRYDYVLQGDCDSGGDQTRECRNCPKFSNKSEDENNGKTAPQDNLAHQHELITPASVVDVTEDRASPKFANQQNCSQC